MRLWHKDLIPYLSQEHLVAQWRECSAIAGGIIKNGTPNHILVNKVLKYDYDHFISYSALIRDEMTKRGYRTMESVWKKITSLKPDYKILNQEEIYPGWMDDTYLKVCYYNLFEKYHCGGIAVEDWKPLDDYCKSKITI